MDITGVIFKKKIVVPLKRYAVSGYLMILCLKLSRTPNRAKRNAVVSFWSSSVGVNQTMECP